MIIRTDTSMSLAPAQTAQPSLSTSVNIHIAPNMSLIHKVIVIVRMKQLIGIHHGNTVYRIFAI